VKLRHINGEERTATATGTGPVDAAYSAINKIVQAPNELLEFTMQAVTEGIDAMAEVTVRVRGQEGDVFTGRGSATDIVVASAKAYVQALNKLLDKRSGVRRTAIAEELERV